MQNCRQKQGRTPTQNDSLLTPAHLLVHSHSW